MTRLPISVRKINKDEVIITLDEYPYLVEANDSVPS